MLQETNLQEKHIAQAKSTASMLGYEACIGPADRAGAGAAIFVNRKLTDLPQATLAQSVRTHMRGRLVIVDIPRANEPPLRVAAMYVPAQPAQRHYFVHKLAESAYLEGVHVLGTDANCVASVTLDTTAASAGDYPNVGGLALEQALTRHDLTDLYRELEGPESSGGYTRVGHSVATRIDRIYVHASLATQWKSICLDIPLLALLAFLAEAAEVPEPRATANELASSWDALTERSRAVQAWPCSAPSSTQLQRRNI